MQDARDVLKENVSMQDESTNVLLVPSALYRVRLLGCTDDSGMSQCQLGDDDFLALEQCEATVAPGDVLRVRQSTLADGTHHFVCFLFCTTPCPVLSISCYISRTFSISHTTQGL